MVKFLEMTKGRNSHPDSGTSHETAPRLLENDPANYVELARKFVELDDSNVTEAAAQSSYLDTLHGGVNGLGWKDLLERPTVVILGEPGSGKSYELRHRWAALSAAGAEAFLIELERLVQEPLEAVLSPEDWARIKRWKRTSRPCHFLLDSLDEAKLRRQTDFHRALDRLRDGIGPRLLGQCRFVISSRISEWRPETDRQEIQARLVARLPTNRAVDNKEAEKSKLLVVQIQRLNTDQVRQLASARGVSDVESFVHALDENFAWDFAGRPLDVLDLVDFWKTNRRLGSLSEIIDFDVRHKLRERILRLNSYTLAEEKAIDGAETLASATLLCQKQQIAVPDEAFQGGDALDARECLPIGWTAEDVNALLNRAIFDSATYGRIRFHHRRIGEFLTARWFTERVKQGCPIRALEQVFFEVVDGVHELRPSLAAVAAWICAGTEPWNADFRAWVLEAAPQIHLEHGDAAALPLDYRRDLLRAWVQRNRGRKRVWISSSPDALRRLAAPELASAVRELLLDNTIALDVRDELVLLVRFGRLTNCIPALLEIVDNASESDTLKHYAVSALRDIAPNDSRRALWNIVRTWTEISAGVCGGVMESLFPEIIGAQDLVGLIQRVSGEEGELRSLTWSLERHLDESLTPELAGPLLEGIINLARLPEFNWLHDIVANVTLRLLEATSLSAEQVAVAADGLFLLGKESDRAPRDAEMREKIELASRRHGTVRQRLFWRLVGDSKIKEKLPRHIWFHTYRGVSFDREDLEWLIGDVESRDNLTERQVALRMALQVCRWRDMSASQRAKLQKSIVGIPALEQMLREHRAGWRWSRLRSRFGRFRDEPWRFRLQRYRHNLVARYTRFRERWRLWRYRRKIRDGSAVRWLIELCWEARDEMHCWMPECWDRMGAARGAGVSAAVQSGCRLAWRRLVPRLPHEKPVANEIDSYIIVGLAAVDVIASDTAALDTMTEEDATLATRYAVNELNGFPDWLTALASTHPAAVGRILNECVSGEWNYSQDRTHSYDVLADLAWIGGPLAALVEETLHNLLRRGDPANLDILTFVLSVLLKVSNTSTWLGEVALDRCRTLAIEDPRFVWWMAVELQLDATKAISVLQERLTGSPIADKIVIDIGALLENRGRSKLPQIANPSFLTPAALRRLIPLVHEYVRISDDVDRSGMGVYTPTERDEAQDFRDSLLTRLSQSASREASAALHELLNEPVLAAHRDWISHLLEERRRQDVERQPWEPADIRSFARDYETDPKTARDLLDIVINRLSDIQNAVERSDNSLREEVANRADEYALRRWLARKLAERSRQRYTVPQEEEIDQEQRPDLRVEHPRTPPVSIEVKWAENWTVQQLLDGLELQLVGQYLRAHESRHGIYFLAIDGRKEHWQGQDRMKLKFEDVARILTARAAQIEAENPSVEVVRVVTIDFRSPSGE